MNAHDKTFDLKFRLYLGVFLILLLPIFWFPYWFSQLSWRSYDFMNTGPIGDTIGGIMGPFVAILAAILTFMAFWVQFKANLKQREDIRLERFESKYYEMVRLHKENINETSIAGLHTGRKAFVRMYDEFVIIYKVVKASIQHFKTDENLKDCKLDYDLNQEVELAYIIFFFGVDEIRDKGSKYYTEDFNSSLVDFIIRKLRKCQKKYSSKPNNHWVSFKLKVGEETIKFDWDYYPFDGHSSKLGHYFRHLYQTIKLATTHQVLNFKNNQWLQEYNARYDYVKVLRVLLSNHEQAMIYYNSFFTAGKVWWGDKSIGKKAHWNGHESNLSYFLDYGMIKNLPFNLIDEIGPEPREEFFNRMMEKGFDIDSDESRAVTKSRIRELFEWGISDDYFNELCSQYTESKNEN